MRVEARNITVELGGKPVLREVDLAVGPGEITGLIGPNGAGKTTLLRALADLVAPAAGAVTYDGRRAGDIGRKELARRIAFLAQGGTVHWQMRARAVVALGRLPHRKPFAEAGAADGTAIMRAMAATDTTAFGDRLLDSLSGGERMRVLLARALAVEAKILLADEPLAGLDPLHQLEAMRLLRDTARGGAGVVVVLHDLTLAGRFCDRLVLLDHGRVLADGAPDEVLADGPVGRAFGIGLARGRHQDQAFVLPWQPLTDRERDS